MKIKTINAEQLKAAYKHQGDGWNFYDERELLETILQNRFNFLLLIYSLFMTVYFMSNNHNDRLTILCIGLLLIFLLSVEIFRAYIRFRILLQMIYCLDEKDVVPVIRNEFKTKIIYNFFPHSSLIGFVIPSVMLLTFIIGIVYNTQFFTP